MPHSSGVVAVCSRVFLLHLPTQSALTVYGGADDGQRNGDGGVGNGADKGRMGRNVERRAATAIPLVKG
jgi:hypothetical protein